MIFTPTEMDSPLKKNDSYLNVTEKIKKILNKIATILKEMVRKDKLKNLKKIIVPILKKNNVARAGIFGSYARGEQKKGSDLDIIIQPPKGMGLKFIGLKLDLEKKLGKKIDLVTYKSISPYLKERILVDEVKIL